MRRTTLGFLRTALSGSPIEKKALIIVLVSLAALDVFRAVHVWTTGFFVSDEFGYIESATIGQVAPALLGQRLFFAYLNIVLFRLLDITSSTEFVYFLPVYLFTWSASTSVLFYKIMKNLGISGRAIAFSLVASLLAVDYLLLSLGFLTEPVGLALTMAGIYLLMKYAKSEALGWKQLAYSLFAALAFSGARFTREPYAIFMAGGAFVVAALALNRLPPIDPRKKQKAYALAIVSIGLFVATSGLFLEYPVPIFAQGYSTAAGFTGTVTQPVVTTTTTSTSVSNVTATFTKTITLGTLTETTVTLVVTQTTLTAVQHQFILNNELVNTFWIFVGGLALGWSPQLLLVWAIGAAVVLSRVLRKRSGEAAMVAALAILALGSYLFVSYIFSPDPSYLRIEHYSTIIRFSDTALPAFFLVIPFAFQRLGKNRRLVIGTMIALIAIAALEVPVYEVYASSNLGLQDNPFTFQAQSGGILIRDYAASHPNISMNVMGFPPGSWWFIPGGDQLKNIKVYDYMNASQFEAQHWSAFYLYVSNPSYVVNNFPYTAQFFNGTASHSTEPFAISSRQTVFNGSLGELIQFHLSWG